MDELSIPQETDLLANGFGGFVAGTMAASHGDRFKKLSPRRYWPRLSRAGKRTS